MLYDELYLHLKEIFDKDENSIENKSLSLKIRKNYFLSPGFNGSAVDSICPNGYSTKDLQNEDIPEICNATNLSNKNLHSNNSFKYYIFQNTQTDTSSGLIFLFHGLNERKWDKYLPWAYQLARLTGKAVIMFPIAFHMNRAPHSWSNPRLMRLVAERRLAKHQNSHSSFANAAISERLESLPQRFFLSGLQTYIDFCGFVNCIRLGQIEGILPNAGIDLFGYSIGAFFSLLLMLDNPRNLLNNSRLFIFCGGATYDRSFPVSKFIIDSRASLSVSSFYNMLFDNKNAGERIIADNFSDFLLTQSHFGCLMNYYKFKGLRESRLSEISERINAVVLKKDNVIPPAEVINTLQGVSGNLKTQIKTMDFEFDYNHIIPFPLNLKSKSSVDNSFKELFGYASSFLA